jgi:phage shock protein PspC (stress-responsive transcriptional regulator)
VEQSTQETFNPESAASPRRLYRSVSDRKLAGVCGGVAEFFGIDTILVRVLWVMSCFFGLLGVLAYIVAWAVVPDNPLGPSAAPPRTSSNTGRYVLGTILIVLGVMWLAERHGFDILVPWHWDEYFVPHWLSWGLIFAVVLILFGVTLVLRGTGRRDSGKTVIGTMETPMAGFTPTGESRMKQKPLMRSLHDRMIGGVCGGMAEYFNIDPSLVRVGWVMLTFFSGFFLGIIAYIVLMVVVPEQKPEANNTASTAGTQ